MSGARTQPEPSSPRPAICPTDDEVLSHDQHKPRRSVNNQSLEYMLKSGLAGGLAGCVAKTVVGPLDQVKIQFQTSNPQFLKYTGSWLGVVKAMKNIYSQTGVVGLFRGHSATLLRIFPYAAIRFLAYEQIRAFIIRDRSQETPVRRFLSGALAGSISVCATYPLEVIRVRLAFESSRHPGVGFVGICKKIFNEHPPGVAAPSLHTRVQAGSATAAAASAIDSTTQVMHDLTPRHGLANFYRGFVPTLWGMLPYAGTSFLTHDYAHDLLRHPSIAMWTTIPNTARDRKPAQLTVWAQLIAGGLAGFVSQTTSYPLEIIRRRMQVGGVVGDGHRLSMTEVASRIWMERGWRGFFVGLGIGYVKIVPMVATTFLVYERLKYSLGI